MNVDLFYVDPILKSGGIFGKAAFFGKIGIASERCLLWIGSRGPKTDL